jgi:hypothetical protein
MMPGPSRSLQGSRAMAEMFRIATPPGASACAALVLGVLAVGWRLLRRGSGAGRTKSR